MSARLDTLRAIAHQAEVRGVLRPIDPDLAAEAGMDGNLARLLQAARDLDEAEAREASRLARYPDPPAGWERDDHGFVVRVRAVTS